MMKLTSPQLWRLLAHVFAACNGWTWQKTALLDLMMYCGEALDLPTWLFTPTEVNALCQARLCRDVCGMLKPVLEPPVTGRNGCAMSQQYVNPCLQAEILIAELNATEAQDIAFEESRRSMYSAGVLQR